MERISGPPHFEKYAVLPLLLVVVSITLWSDEFKSKAAILQVGFLAVCVCLAIFHFRKSRALLDEVILDGDCLLMRRGDVRVSLPLNDILTIDRDYWANITLTTGRATPFGTEITFIAKRDAFAFGMRRNWGRAAEETLRRAVDQAKQRARISS